MTTSATPQVRTRSAFRERFSATELMISIFLLVATFPFVEDMRGGELIISILFTLVLVCGVLVTAGHRRVLWAAVLLAGPTLLARWISHYRPDLVPTEVFLVGEILFVLLVITTLLRFILTAPSVDREVLCASIAAYLLLALVWAIAYQLVAELVPNAFAFNIAGAGDKSIEGFNGIYFSLITLCTVGYGDITPIAKAARILAALEAVTGLLYVAVLIARLVAVQASPKSSS